MGSVPPLFSFLLMIVSGWVHRHQLIVIEFLQAENRLLKERLRGKRIRFTDAERALLARKAKAVGRKALCLANYYSRSDWRVEKALAMLLPSVGIKRSAGGTRFARLLLWGVPT